MFLGSLWHFGSCPDLLTVCGSLGLLGYISTSASFPGFMLLVSDAFPRKGLGKHEGIGPWEAVVIEGQLGSMEQELPLETISQKTGLIPLREVFRPSRLAGLETSPAVQSLVEFGPWVLSCDAGVTSVLQGQILLAGPSQDQTLGR